MYTKKIKYEDYKGNMREEEFQFYLSKADIIKWLTTDGDYTLDEALERLVQKRNGKEVMKTFEDLIYQSYGEVSLDGRRFDRSQEVKDAFLQTEAYSALFTELITNANAAVEFIQGIIPKEMAEDVRKAMAENIEKQGLLPGA